jgi:tagatose-1,6-bisphosphate aldolase
MNDITHFPAYSRRDEELMIQEIREEGATRQRMLDAVKFMVTYRASNPRIGSVLDDAIEALAKEFNRRA